ncbi:YbfB/YjiJ family MFS transporter [Castellaniella sp. GW247-6E4]|uniref:YbfB/YjiJ family MFS transporter n=1 Tax=Castellaniella sp. GW247-6E4 TaxID=3140380 RepID=UPI0033164AFB
MILKSIRLPLPLAGLLALAVAMGIGRFAFTPVLPMMQAHLGISLAEGGWLAGANYLGYLVGALMAARLLWPADALLRRGLWLVVLMTAAMGMTGHWAAWLLWRFLAGVASAWVIIGTAALCIARLNAAGRTEQGGVVFAGVGCGIAFAGVACMALTLVQAPPSQAWLLLALAALCGLVGASALWADSPAASAAASPASGEIHEAAAGGNPEPATKGERLPGLHWGLIWCYGVFGFGYILPATFLPAQARMLVPDPLLFSLAWPVFGLASAVSTLIASRLLRRYTRCEIWAAAQIVMAIGVLMPVWIHNLAAILVAAVCVGSAFMVITMVGLQEAQARVAPSRAKTQMAAMTASFALGQLVGPLFFSFTDLLFSAGLGLALVLGAIGLVVGAIPILRLQDERRIT